MKKEALDLRLQLVPSAPPPRATRSSGVVSSGSDRVEWIGASSHTPTSGSDAAERGSFVLESGGGHSTHAQLDCDLVSSAPELSARASPSPVSVQSLCRWHGHSNDARRGDECRVITSAPVLSALHICLAALSPLSSLSLSPNWQRSRTSAVRELLCARRLDSTSLPHFTRLHSIRGAQPPSRVESTEG